MSAGPNEVQDHNPFHIDDGGKGGGGGLIADPQLGTSSVDADILAGSGIQIQVPDGAGGWLTVAHRYPREHLSGFSTEEVGHGPCRLVFLGTHRVDFVGRLAVAPEAMTTLPLSLLEARHSRAGDVRGPLVAGDGVTVQVVPGDTVALAFQAPAVGSGLVRDLFLVSLGVYSSTRPPAFAQRESGLPVRFALEPNQPNPFAGETTIRFALPTAARVRLEVFDPQGRRVGLLADGEFPPGHHAVQWNRRDPEGRVVRPGVYVCALRAGTFHERRKMVVLPQ